MSGNIIYVAGPMSGYAEDNVPAFEEAGDWLRENGWHPILPHLILPVEHDGVCKPGPKGESAHTAPCHLKADIAELVHADAAVFLRGWNASAGARLEMQVAAQCGLDLFIAGYGYPREILPNSHSVFNGMRQIA